MQQISATTTEPARLLRLADVQAIAGLSGSTIRRLEAEGNFPRRRQLSARAVGWQSDEIAEWLAARPEAQP